MSDGGPPGPGDGDYASGWDALDTLFSAAFPGQEPHHWKADDVFLPAQDAVWGISAYRDVDAWFYVTYGLTDLFDAFRKPDLGTVAPDEVVWSGFGFELTMRVLSDDATPPRWPVQLLDKLGKYVFSQHQPLEPGHRLDPGGPITGGAPATRLVAVAFAHDPAFTPIETAMGRVEFVTVFRVTGDEPVRMGATTTDTVLTDLRATSPRLVTDLAR